MREDGGSAQRGGQRPAGGPRRARGADAGPARRGGVRAVAGGGGRAGLHNSPAPASPAAQHLTDERNVDAALCWLTTA